MRVMNEKELIMNLKVRRKSMGLSQRGLADATGLSIDVILSLESGRRKLMNSKATTLIRLSEALNCTPDNLLLKEED